MKRWVASFGRAAISGGMMLLVASVPACFRARSGAGSSTLLVSPQPYFWVDQMPSVGPRDAELRLSLDLHVINGGEFDVRGFGVRRAEIRSAEYEHSFILALEPVHDTSPTEVIPAHSDVVLHYMAVSDEPAHLEKGTMLYGVVYYEWSEGGHDRVVIPPTPLEYTY
jgi:hypothetical protein